MNNLQKIVEKFSPILKGWEWSGKRAFLQGADIFTTTTEVSQPYKQIVWIYIALNRIITNLAQCPFKIYRNNNELMDHPVSRLFNFVNPISSKYELWEISALHLIMKGEIFWLFAKSKGQEADVKGAIPAAIYPTDPDYFEHVTDDNGELTGWILRRKGQRIPYKPDELIHFKRANPYNPYRGMGLIDPLKYSMETDFEAIRYNRNFFRNSAVLSGIISFDEGLSEEQFERFRKQFQERHEGIERAHKTAILEGKGGKYTTIGISQRDMDFMNQRRTSREEMLGAAGVPKTEVSISDNQAMPYAREQKKIFWNDTILPIQTLFEDKLKTDFFDRYLPSENLRGKFDLSEIPELQEDLNEKADVTRKFYDMGIPINQLIEKFNLPFEKVPWGDQWWIPMSLYPTNGRPAPQPMGEIEGESPVAGLIEYKRKRWPGIETREGRDLYWEKAIEHTGRWEEKMISESRKILGEMKTKTLQSIAANWEKRDFSGWAIQKVKDTIIKDKIDDLIFEYDWSQKRWTNGMKPLINGVYKEGGRRAIDLLQVDVFFNMNDPNIIRWIEKRTGKISKYVTDTMSDEIKTILRDGMEKGLTVRDMTDNIGQYFDTTERYKAERIARTETMTATNEATEEAYRQSGIVEGKIFITARDELVCDICGPLDNEEVDMGQSFKEGDPPIHPNCRCTIAPVTKEE